MEIQVLLWNAWYSLRMIVFTGMNLCMACSIMSWMLKKRNSYKGLVLFLIGKLLVINWFFNQMCYSYIQSDVHIWAVYMIVLCLFNIGFYFVLIYTYDAPLIKLFFVVPVSEVITTSCGSLNIWIINSVERREELLTLNGRFQPFDICLVVLAYVEWRLIRKIGGPLFQKIKAYELKHQAVWFCFWGFYFVLGLISMQVLFRENLLSVLISSVILWAGLCIVVGILGIYMYQSYRRQVIRRHRFLKTQRELIIIHSRNIQKQIDEMEQFRQEIDSQVTQILESAGEEGSADRMERYLEQLKQQYQAIEAGIYCNDWMIDATLSYMAQRYERMGIPCQFLFSHYDPGEIVSEDVSELLLRLLNLPIKSEMKLKAKAIGNNLFFELDCDDAKKKKTVLKAVFPVLRKYNGEVWKDDKYEGNRYLIRLSRTKRSA